MRLGVRAHDFGKLPVEELAKRIADKGFTSIQLALPKAIEGIAAVNGILNPGMAFYIRETFQKYNIQIAILGCYINLAGPDMKERKKSLNRFKEHLRFARDFGCSVVATETGSLNEDYSYHPQNESESAFDTVVESVKQLTDEAEKFGVFVGIEGVSHYVISTPQKMKKLIDRVQSSNLQVVLDTVNFLDNKNYQNQDKIIQESFELFGDKIIAVHAKDYVIDNGDKKNIQIGKGIFNYKLFLEHLKIRKPHINVLFEGVNTETVHESIKYLNEIYDKI